MVEQKQWAYNLGALYFYMVEQQLRHWTGNLEATVSVLTMMPPCNNPWQVFRIQCLVPLNRESYYTIKNPGTQPEISDGERALIARRERR